MFLLKVDKLFKVIDWNENGFVDKYEFADVFRKSSRSHSGHIPASLKSFILIYAGGSGRDDIVVPDSHLSCLAVL